ncbi:VIN3-like protein 2 [Spinacia oleracea]|uniref:VIN3-like protein 2 n=1 Tax=Spinacia oleracea TaxID=3562 RepID=A0A9R0IVX9_SPIOL|nr:VIN3-like protein 2 [Spinacia oleracea]
MEANLKGLVLDPTKCGGLPLEEKRELVREIAQWPEDAPEILSSFSRKELLEIICAEMGKERKYSGFTKLRMIQHLLQLISKNSKRKNIDIDNDLDLSMAKSQNGAKKQRKSDQDSLQNLSRSKSEVVKTLLLCPNLACRATLTQDDGFCKRCSCCVCHHYDDNKDPSLWLTCDSDPPNEGDSCGMSCHINCALKHERTGILKNCKRGKADGRFYCVSCGKINDLMSTWRKQLLVVKEARRVDVLCLRISLCHKILDGTERYKDLHKPIDIAAKKLRKELGPLDRVCEKMGRGIVNRLACGAEVQKLCASALDAFDALSTQPYTCGLDQENTLTCQIRFEESFPTSVVIVLDYNDRLFEEFLGCRIWHQKSALKSYPEKPSCIVLKPEKKFQICDLQPDTEYACRVSLFSCTSIFGTWEAKWLTPPSVEMFPLVSDEQVSDEHDDVIIDEKPMSFFKSATVDDHTAKLRSLNDINDTHIVSSGSINPITPSKVDTRQDLVVGPSIGPSNKMVVEELNRSYEYCVKVIKSLERVGHLSIDFRVKFLTWFSLKATMRERRVVSAFVDTMVDDPPSLAEQLTDAFADEIYILP